MEPIPSATFDPEDYTPDEAPRAWRRFFQSLHHVTPLLAPGQRFSSRSGSWMIDDIMVGYAKFGAQTMERKLSSEIVQAAACKFLMGWRYRSGQAKVYHAGDYHGLFVMHKLAADTPDTDQGWIYGTIDAKGKVTAAGKVASCIRCHRDADEDRRFGLR